MDALLTVRHLQDLLQVDRITIYRMLDDGRLRGFKVGGQWRFSRQAIEGWLHERILAELGEVRSYVHERLGKPLFDISGQAFIADRVPYRRRGRYIALFETTWALAPG